MELETSLQSDAKSQNGRNGETDRDKLLGIFPEEIWEMILDHVEQVNDFTHMALSTPLFECLIKPRRVLYLFPSVWKILAIRYERRQFKDSSYNQVIDDNDPATRMTDYAVPYGSCSDCGGEKCAQWYSGILNMRSVCRTWSKAIDDYYQSIPLTDKFPEGALRSRQITHEEFSNSIPSTIHFGQHFTKTHAGDGRGARSPFIGRTVNLDLDFEEAPSPEYQEYLNAVTLIFEQFGRHVWHWEITAYAASDTTVSFYLKFRQLLSFMPNLKTLQLEVYPANDQLQISYTGEQRTEILSAIRDNPMSRMEHLDRLRINYYLPAPIFNELIRCNGNVSLFDFNIPLENCLYNLQLAKNVKQLSVTFCTGLDFKSLFRSAEHWKLENLNLQFESITYLDWSEIFSVINASAWSDTLTNLTISLPTAGQDDEQKKRIAEGGNTFRLNLKCVKHLELGFCNISNLDFILPMSETLESLDIRIHLKRDGEDIEEMLHAAASKDQIINFVGYFQRPLESNIWTLFKKLKHFRFYSSSDRTTDTQRTWAAKFKHSRYDWWKHQRQCFM